LAKVIMMRFRYVQLASLYLSDSCLVLVQFDSHTLELTYGQPSKASEDPWWRQIHGRMARRQLWGSGYHDPKAVATKEETIYISSPGHQPHECDAQQAEEATMSQKFVITNIWMVKIWQIHEHLPNFLVPKFPSVRYTVHKICLCYR